jgi:peptide/nickel transport system permease protein
MLRYILRRTLFLIPVMLGVSFIVFSLIHFTPGDPAMVILGESAPPEAIEQLREEMGLDDPFLVQYGRYVFNVVTNLILAVLMYPDVRFLMKSSDNSRIR